MNSINLYTAAGEWNISFDKNIFSNVNSVENSTSETLNKLSPETFKFSRVIKSDASGSGWLIAAVEGLSMSEMNPSFWKAFLRFDWVVNSDPFNIEVGVPGFIDPWTASVASANSANQVFSDIFSKGFYFFEALVVSGTLPAVFKTMMTADLRVLLNFRITISTILSGDVPASAPVIISP